MTPVTWKIKHRITGSLLVLTRGAWQFWVTVLILLILFFAPRLWTDCRETWFRQAGVLLQLAGLGTVALGIYETRRRFGRPSLAKRFKEWLASLKNAVLLPPITGSGHVTVAPGVGGLALTGFPPTITTTPEERLRAIEAAVDELQKRLAKVVADSAQTAEDLRTALADEAGARDRADREVRLLIEEQAAGGLHLEVMGLVWLLVGTLLGWF